MKSFFTKSPTQENDTQATASSLRESVEHIQIYAKQKVLDLFAGMYHSTFKGQGIEPIDIREYIPGDDVRAISWPKTAQFGRPFIKNFQEERDLTVVIAVDISASLQWGGHFETKRECLAKAASLIAFSAIYNRDKVGLILFSSNIEKYIPPKRGSKHGMRLIREMLSFSPQEKGTNFECALQGINQMVKKRCICFLLSDFFPPPLPEKAFALAAQQHDLIACRIFDPEEMTLPELRLVRIRDPETGKTALIDINAKVVKELERAAQASSEQLEQLVHRIGASLITLSTQGGFEKALRAFFKIRSKTRH